MAIHMPRNAAATEPRPADSPLAHPVHGDLWTTPIDEATAIDETTLKTLKPEEIIFIRKAPHPTDGFLIYRLLEPSPEDAAKPTSSPFTLSILSTSHLPSDLSSFLITSTLPPHLQPPRAIDVIVSTRSGTGQAPHFYSSVLQPLLGALGLAESEGSDGYPNRFRLVTTTSSRSVSEYAAGLDPAAGERTVILLSGDGGLVDLLNGLDSATHPTNGLDKHPTTPTITLLPLGTANALFHSLHKPHYTPPSPPSPLTLALRTLIHGTPFPLPTFKVSFSPGATLVASGDPVRGGGMVGAIVASYGFHAQLVWESDTPAYREFGEKRFGIVAGELLKGGKVYDSSLAVRRGGGELLGGEGEGGFERVGGEGFTYILATMVSNLERGFTISPDGRPLDGRLRVVHFGDVGGRTMEIMMGAYRGGEHVGMEGVGYEGGEGVEEVRVEVREGDKRWRKVCVDGTIVEVEEGGWFVVRREGEGGRVRVLRF